MLICLTRVFYFEACGEILECSKCVMRNGCKEKDKEVETMCGEDWIDGSEDWEDNQDDDEGCDDIYID